MSLIIYLFKNLKIFSFYRKASESEAVEDKEEIIEQNGTANDKKKKKKKKKTSKEVLQKKKEKKRYELEDQYKNVDLPSFKDALVDTINVNEASETPSEVVPKKKKAKIDTTEDTPKKKKAKKQ